MACAPSKDSHQPGHPPGLTRVFNVCMKKAWVLSYPLSRQRRLWLDWADAPADLHLRWAQSHFVGFVMWRLKWKQVAQRATIAHLSAMCQVNLPQNLMQPFPHPNDATHKIWSRLTNWLQRHSSSKVWNFCHSRASNSKMSGLIWPKIELDRAFIPVLVTSNFDDNSIKNEQASMETPFSHYKSMGNF